MRNRTLFSALTAFVLPAFIAGGAQAADKTWDGSQGNGSWNDGQNWTPAGVPTSTDDVEFPALSGTYTVTMDPAVGNCQYLTMNANATLSITGGNVLRIHDNTSTNSQIAGNIVLAGSGSILRIMNDHTFAPKSGVLGFVSGQHDLAKIEIVSGKTFTNQINIQGALQIVPESGSGTFVNGSGGVVNANNNTSSQETLLIDPGTLGAGAGTFKVSLDGSVLRFLDGNASLTGDFLALAGTLDFQATVATSGGLCFKKNGSANTTISVLNGFTFSATGAPVSCP